MFNVLPVLSKVSKFKSNKLRFVPFVDDCGNDVRRSELEIMFWLAGKEKQIVFILFNKKIINKHLENNLHKFVGLLFKDID